MIFTRSITLLAFVFALPAIAQEVPRFNHDVRPILSDKCYPCHGPDKNTRKAGLRLDNREEALKAEAFVPGDALASALIKRITSTDPDEQMPPPESELKLSPGHIDTLTRWIAGGAEYEPHWAFVPPADVVAVPAVDDPAGWAASPIDAFVLQRLQAEGLAPSPAADKSTLLRRVSLDLTGLPPTLEEQDAFLSDSAPDAYARVVERLLASPAYGERMALDWLDAARYADTFGYQADVEMDMWPWRDWVIKALNDNLPYDLFITWQVAGDLLDHPSQEQRLATGFNRLHRQTNEGGSINEEFRVANVSDRTETFSTALLGLTTNCAKCHDHKFDPISQRDYYSLSAFFANIDESGLYSHFTHTAPTPSMLLYKEGEEEKHRALKDAVAERSKEQAGRDAAARARLDAWLAYPAKAVRDPQPIVHWTLDAIEDGKAKDSATPGNVVTLSLNPVAVPGIDGNALAFNGDNGVESAAADFERWQPFTASLWLKTDAIAPRAVLFHHSKAETDAASRGWEILLIDGRPQFSLIHFWPGDAIRVISKTPIPVGAWVNLTARYDGSSTASGLEIFLDGTRLETEVVRDNLFKTIRYEGGGTNLTLANRFRDAGFHGAVDDVRVYDAALATLEIEALARRRSVADHLASATALGERALLEDYFVRRVDTFAGESRARLGAARKDESAFVETVRNIMTMEDMRTPRQSYILARGEYTRRTEPVQPDTPAAVAPFPSGQPRNRLGLARWLTDPRHPLTARVAVNRYWQIFFGRGIVETQEDFGAQGHMPTHPELLDYLARTFINSGWDLKGLCRSIVLSSTYRQSSLASAELLERDPFNQLLARGASFRLSAEQIRDCALTASGLLTRTIGGPSVKPYQPAGLWEDASSVGYTPDTGPNLYRRGLYTFIKRTVPPPSSLTFDGVTRETCVVRRERTTTPLQALVLLNDPQYVEAARVLAEKVLAAAPAGAPEGAEWSMAEATEIFRALTSRPPTPEELGILRQIHDDQLAWFREHPDDAAKYATAGSTPPTPNLDPIQTATLTALAQATMNLDDFQMRR